MQANWIITNAGMTLVGIVALHDELIRVCDDCRRSGVPMDQEVLRTAHSFLNALPPDLPAPSVGAEPDGDLTLEWRQSAQRTLSLSVSRNGELHFAGLLGPDLIIGAEAFSGDVPERLLGLIRQVYL